MQGNEDDPIREKYLNHWQKTWQGFTSAIVSTEDFHAFQWTIKLFKAGFCVLYIKSGVYKLKIHIYWRSWIPPLAIVLVVLVVSSYFGSLREVVRERWCFPAGEETNNSYPIVIEGEGCRWLRFHDAVVLYIGFMILFNFVSACFRSPGVVLPNPQPAKDSAKKKYPKVTSASSDIGNQ